MTKKVAFLGLGVMGYPMAGHLVKAGFEVTVYNRTTSKAQAWQQEFTGEYALTPKDAVNGADVVCLCVGNDDDVRSVCVGEQGIIHGLSEQAVIIDHTTTSAKLAKEMSNAFAPANPFLDAPVSGGQAGAENGKLTVMLGGNEAVYQTVTDVLDAFSQYHRLLGDVGSGQSAKMMNQICIAGVVQGLAEALKFGKNAGMDCAAVIDVISRGAAQSWQMQNRFETMLAGHYEHGFAVDWMRKDLGIALSEASANGSTLPLTALVDQFYADVQKMGGGRWDTSSLLARLDKD